MGKDARGALIGTKPLLLRQVRQGQQKRGFKVRQQGGKSETGGTTRMTAAAKHKNYNPVTMCRGLRHSDQIIESEQRCDRSAAEKQVPRARHWLFGAGTRVAR
jgi:hypothetical protein